MTTSRARAAGSTMIRMLRAGATSESCSRVGERPRARPRQCRRRPRTRTGTASRRGGSSRRSRALLAWLRVTNGHWRHPPRDSLGVRARRARRCPARAAEPLVLPRAAARDEAARRATSDGSSTSRVITTNSSSGTPPSSSTAYSGETLAGSLQPCGTSALAGPARPTRATEAGGRGGDEDDAPARNGLEDGSHDEQDIRMPRRVLDRSASNGSHPARGPERGAPDV